MPTNKSHISSSKTYEQYKNIFTHLEESILVVDKNRTIITCNPAFKRLFGYSLSQIKGKKPEFVYQSTEQYKKVGELINESPKTRITIPEIIFKKKNGDWFPGEVTFSRILNKSNRCIGFIGMVRDITATKNLITKDKILHKNEEEKERMRIQNEFLNSASHELKTPLTSLQLQLQLLEHMAGTSKGISQSDIRHCVSVSERQIKQLSRLINDMLDVSYISHTNTLATDKKSAERAQSH